MNILITGGTQSRFTDYHNYMHSQAGAWECISSIDRIISVSRALSVIKMLLD
jgi:hypothetical protein